MLQERLALVQPPPGTPLTPGGGLRRCPGDFAGSSLQSRQCRAPLNSPFLGGQRDGNNATHYHTVGSSGFGRKVPPPHPDS